VRSSDGGGAQGPSPALTTRTGVACRGAGSTGRRAAARSRLQRASQHHKIRFLSFRCEIEPSTGASDSNQAQNWRDRFLQVCGVALCTATKGKGETDALFLAD
jgi:hypothetical protein